MLYLIVLAKFNCIVILVFSGKLLNFFNNMVPMHIMKGFL